MSFNLQAVKGWLSVPVQTVATTFLPTLGGKKETLFLRVLMDQFSKFQKISYTMDTQNPLFNEGIFWGTVNRKMIVKIKTTLFTTRSDIHMKAVYEPWVSLHSRQEVNVGSAMFLYPIRLKKNTGNNLDIVRWQFF